MPNEAPALHLLPRSALRFRSFSGSRLRVSKATLAALGAGAALTRAARSLCNGQLPERRTLTLCCHSVLVHRQEMAEVIEQRDLPGARWLQLNCARVFEFQRPIGHEAQALAFSIR